MGFGLEHVQSERTHYVSFLCQICNELADIDALVTGQCSHPFCRPCMDTWLKQSSTCPSCHLGLEASLESMRCTNCQQDSPYEGLAIYPLVKAQPLAHACMSTIQIFCPHCRTWEGPYGGLPEHMRTCPVVSQIARPPMEAEQIPQQHSSGVHRRGSMDGGVCPPVSNPSISSKIGRRRTMDMSPARSISQSPEDMRRSADAYGEYLGMGNYSSNYNKSSPAHPSIPEMSNNDFETANVLKEKGNAKFNKGEYDEARSFYNEALELVKDSSTFTEEERQTVSSVYCNRGATHAKEKNYALAIEDYDKALRVQQDCSKAFSRKFKALAAMSRIREAKSCLENGILAIPGDKALLDDLRKTKQIVDKMDSVKDYLKAHKYFEAKQEADALMELTDCVEAVLLSAEADASNAEISAALEKCDFILSSDPKCIMGLRTKGYVKLLGGSTEAACNLLKEALNHDPGHVEANDTYQLCRKVDKGLTDGRICMAKANGSRTLMKKAVDHFSTPIDDDLIPRFSPLYCQLLVERAEAELQLQHYPSSLSDARMALEIEPKNIRAWVAKSDAYIASGRAKEARDELTAIKRGWACDLEEIKEAHKKATFECKILEADKELRSMVDHLVDNKGGGKLGDHLSRSSSHENHGYRRSSGDHRLRDSSHDDHDSRRRPSGDHISRDSSQDDHFSRRRPSGDHRSQDIVSPRRRNSGESNASDKSGGDKKHRSGIRSRSISTSSHHRDDDGFDSRRSSNKPGRRGSVSVERSSSAEAVPLRKASRRMSMADRRSHSSDGLEDVPRKSSKANSKSHTKSRPVMSETDIRRRMTMI